MNDLTLITPPPGLSGADYAMIEQAVMETARGRWFLLEYARRQRAAETQRLSEVVDRLEAMLAGNPSAPAREPYVLQDGCQTIQDGCQTTQNDAALLAERLSDLAWRLREDGAHPDLCAELEREVAALRPAQASTIETPAQAHDKDDEADLASLSADAREKIVRLARIDNLPLGEKLALFC
ncbi:MAG: hypothetical protein ACK5JM_13265 [Rhodoblastus sp.]